MQTTAEQVAQQSQSEPDGHNAIQIEGLTKRFGKVTAVKDANFYVRAGDVFGLLGPNGAGKTTIIRMLVGLVKPTAGIMKVFGFNPITERRAVLQRSSTILEAPAMYPKLNAFDNLKAMGLLVGVHSPRKVHEVLETIRLLDRAKDKFETYSLGMKQRLCIAASLLTDPELIILDEPTNGLDPAGMHDIRELIYRLAQQGRTVLLSSHLLNEVQQVCNRVAILQRGTVLVQGNVSDLLAGKSSIKVRVARDEIPKAQQILQQTNGWSDQVRSEGDYLLVNAMADQGRAINQALVANGIFASEITPDKISLEEYYLRLTDSPPTAAAPEQPVSALELFHDN